MVESWWTKKTLRSSPTLVESSPSVTRRRTVKANWFEGTFACPWTTTPDGGAEKFVPGGKAAITAPRFSVPSAVPGRRGGVTLASKPIRLALEPLAKGVKVVGSMPTPNSSVHASEVPAPRSADAVPTIGTVGDWSGSSTWNHAGRSIVASGGIFAGMPSAGTPRRSSAARRFTRP